MGNFFDLISAFLGCNILSVVHSELRKFLDELNQCLKNEREPLFTAELGFSKEGKLFSKILKYHINAYYMHGT